jgi:transcriptional regulator with XRE-family HTH domain
MTEMKRLRGLAGVSQARLARMAKIDRSIISLAETGQIRLRPQKLRMIRTILLTAVRERMDRSAQALEAHQMAERPGTDEKAPRLKKCEQEGAGKQSGRRSLPPARTQSPNGHGPQESGSDR